MRLKLPREDGRMRRSNPVEELVWQCKAAGLPEPWREPKFHPKRKWRLDLLFPPIHTGPNLWPATAREYPLAVEVEGGVYLPGGSRHTRGKGFEADCEKYFEAMALGYRILRVTPRHIREGKALAWIEKLLS